MVLPSFFYAIASSESRQLISLDELQRIITLDAMTQARTEDCISPLQRPHYFTSSYTYLFSKKVILLSFLG